MQHRQKVIPFVAVYLAVVCTTCNYRYDPASKADFCYNKLISLALLSVASVQKKNHDFKNLSSLPTNAKTRSMAMDSGNTTVWPG